MTDLKAQVLDTAIRTQEIKSVIEKHRSISFRSLDHVTQQLEKIYCQLNYIEVKISQIDSRRVEVKKQIDESENRLKKYSDLLPYQGNQRLILDPLFIKASSLHSDATTSYIYRQFDTASKWLAISQEISQLGRLVCEMQSVVFYLEKVRSKEQILPKFYTDFDNVVHKYKEICSLAVSENQTKKIKGFQKEAKKLSKRANKLFKQNEKTTRKLTQKNNKLWDKLNTECEILKKIAPFSMDPLIIQYESLSVDNPTIKRNQNKLFSANEKIIELTKAFQSVNQELHPIHSELIHAIQVVEKNEENAQIWSQEWICLQFNTEKLEEQTFAAKNILDDCRQSQSISALKNLQTNLRDAITSVVESYECLSADREKLNKKYRLAVDTLVNAEMKVHRGKEIVQHWPCLMELFNRLENKASRSRDVIDGIKKVGVFDTVLLRLDTISDASKINADFEELAQHEKWFEQSLSIITSSLKEIDDSVSKALFMSSRWVCLKEPANSLKSNVGDIRAKGQEIQNLRSLDLATIAWKDLLQRAKLLQELEAKLSGLIVKLTEIESDINKKNTDTMRWIQDGQNIGSTWKCLKNEAKELEKLYKKIQKSTLDIHKMSVQEIEKTAEDFNILYRTMKNKFLTLKQEDNKLVILELEAKKNLAELRKEAEKVEGLAKKWRFYQFSADTLYKHYHDAQQMIRRAKEQQTLQQTRNLFIEISSLAMRIWDYKKLEHEYEDLLQLEAATKMYLDGIRHEEWGSRAAMMESRMNMVQKKITEAKNSPNARNAAFHLADALNSARTLFNEIPSEQIQQNQFLYDINISANEIYGLLFGPNGKINQNF
ncbi:MAG: hypothetical protein H6653_14145 [Ardenticatenaceae bacterium]|nr:hypothetical protein [Ardenticatenaceae bacterium]